MAGARMMARLDNTDAFELDERRKFIYKSNTYNNGQTQFSVMVIMT